MHASNSGGSSFGKARAARFGDFELDFQTGELAGPGQKVRLGEKPLQALTCLVENAGEVVTREQLSGRLWPSGTFVEFDDNLNATIRRLRQALRDSADRPAFIETIPRVGYRFVPIPTLTYTATGNCDKPGALLKPAESGQDFPIRQPRWVISLSLFFLTMAIVALSSRNHSTQQIAYPAAIKIGIVGFTNASGTSDEDFLADGLSALVTARLQQLAPPQLIVISDLNSDVAAGRRHNATVEAQALAVDYLLNGSLQRDGDGLRLVTKLTKGGTREVWTAAYRLPIQETFVEDDIARKIRITFSLNSQPQARSDLSRLSTADTSAYDCYMRGIYALHLDQIASLQESIKWFKQSVQRDAEYARPHAGLAQAYLRLAELRALSRQQAEENARNEIALGMNLDSSSAAFYWLRASMLASRPGNYEQSVQLYRRAIEVAPQNPESHVQYALFLRERRPKDALREINIALQLEPHSAWVNACFGWVLISADRLDEADRQLTIALHMDPASPATMRFLGVLEEKRGRIDRSTFWFEKAASASERRPYYVYRLAISYAKSGRIDQVQRLLGELRTKARHEPVDPRYIQILDAALRG